jgi:hypothetical protein
MNSWKPLLTGALAERARQVVDEIAGVLAPPPAAPDARPEEQAAGALLPGPSLAGGSAGGALFFAYRAHSQPGNAVDTEAAAILLERCTEALATTPLSPDLYGGFAGVAWTAEHLYSPRFADPEDADPGGEAGGRDDRDADAGTTGDEDPLAEIDDALLHYLERTPWTADYDLIRGLAGLGVYALERLPRRSAVACLDRIVQRLAETAEHGPQGITWHTAPELLPDWQRETFPQGYYNLGMAHGVPAVIALLGATAAAAARLAEAGDREARELARRAGDLREGSTRWLLAQRLPAGEPCWFGATFSPEIPAGRSRLAWCYGDPGVAAAMLVAARTSGDAALERLAVELALDAAARPADTAGVRDAGLCHGSAGLGHLFNRLYQETGEQRLAEASRAWFEAALDFRQPDTGLAGYRAFWMDDDRVTESWRDDAGLLEGVAGIGLALLGGLSSFEPAWDRVLMLSAATLPPQPPAQPLQARQPVQASVPKPPG